MDRIMVVDDEAAITMELEECLTSMGYEVVGSASSGEEAIGMARRLRPDIVLMDIVMPGKLDGIEASKEIKAELDIPIVFVTAYTDDKLIGRAKKVQPVGYIVKPFQEEEIKAAIEVGLYKKRAEEQLRRSQHELETLCRDLHSLASYLQSVRDGEKRSIAQELYDDLGQTLTALKMDLASLSHRLLKEQELLLGKMDSMGGLIDRTIQTIRRICTELTPKMLDDLGITAAIGWQAEELQNKTGIKCELTLGLEDIVLDQERSTAIFHIFQEAVTNVARHAKATSVKASLKEKDGNLVLEVIDDGVGITEEQISDPKSLGLIEMRERVYPFGGEFKISGTQGKGTAVTASIPLDSRGENG